MVEVAEFIHVLVEEHRMRQLELVAVLRGFVEQVPLASHEAHERHDEIFAVGVDGRIGDLGEELLEIVVEQLRPSDSTASAASLPMEPTGSCAVFGHGLDDHLDFFARVPEHPLRASSAHGDATGPAPGKGP